MRSLSHPAIFVGAVIAVFAFLNGPIFLFLPLTIDAEMSLLHYTPDVWVGQGRWATYLVSTYLFTNPVVPFFPYAFFGVCIALSYTLVLLAAGLSLDFRAVALSAVFSSHPVWSFILEFPANTPATGLALMCCAAATAILYSRRSLSLRIVLQIPLLAFAIGAYQIFVLVYAAMVLACALLEEREDGWSSVFAGGVTAVMALVIYAGVNRAFLGAFGYSETYLSGFLNGQALYAEPLRVVGRVFSQLAEVLGGAPSVYGSPLWAAGALVVAAAFGLSARISLLRVLAFLGLLAVPFAMNPIAGGVMPHRSLLAVPVTLWAMAWLGSSSASRLLRFASIAAVAIFAFQSAGVVASHQAQRIIAADYDRQTATLLLDRISSVANINQPTRIDFYGSLQAPRIYPTGAHSTAAASFFGWDGGNPSRMVAYLKTRGINTLTLLSSDEREAYRPELEAMPVWPSPGSVKVFQGAVLVRLGREPGCQIAACSAQSNRD